MSPFWLLEFKGGCWISEKSVLSPPPHPLVTLHSDNLRYILSRRHEVK
jgi:hypothetical protein